MHAKPTTKPRLAVTEYWARPQQPCEQSLSVCSDNAVFLAGACLALPLQPQATPWPGALLMDTTRPPWLLYISNTQRLSSSAASLSLTNLMFCCLHRLLNTQSASRAHFPQTNGIKVNYMFHKYICLHQPWLAITSAVVSMQLSIESSSSSGSCSKAMVAHTIVIHKFSRLVRSSNAFMVYWAY